MSITRSQFAIAVDQAHECLHAGKTDEAHELLHSVGAGAPERIECATADPEAQSLMAEFIEKLRTPMPCGHTLGDLTFAPGTVTKCGACMLANQQQTSDGLGMTGETYAQLQAELRRGRTKFPGNRLMLAALVEEVGEVSRALLQRKGREAVRDEALQVAAVALRIAEEGDATFSDVSDEEAQP